MGETNDEQRRKRNMGVFELPVDVAYENDG
jgi:hypothetical protein